MAAPGDRMTTLDERMTELKYFTTGHEYRRIIFVDPMIFEFCRRLAIPEPPHFEIYRDGMPDFMQSNPFGDHLMPSVFGAGPSHTTLTLEEDLPKEVDPEPERDPARGKGPVVSDDQGLLVDENLLLFVFVLFYFSFCCSLMDT